MDKTNNTIYHMKLNFSKIGKKDNKLRISNQKNIISKIKK